MLMKRQQFSSIPTATGGITRVAYARGVELGLDIEPLLRKSGLSASEVKNSQFRIAVENQIKFLNLVADAISDEFLGIHLAECADLRELGLQVTIRFGETLPSRARPAYIRSDLAIGLSRDQCFLPRV